MSEIKIRLRAIVGHEHLTVLTRVHRPRIDIKIGIKLLHENPVAATLQQERKGRRGNPLAQTRNHSAGDKNVFDLLFHFAIISLN